MIEGEFLLADSMETGNAFDLMGKEEAEYGDSSMDKYFITVV